MVSLPLLARLLDAVRPDARLVLVGDPFQLASIEAGTVMGDMVGPADRPGARRRHPLAGRVTELRRGHRFDEGSQTAALPLAVRTGTPTGHGPPVRRRSEVHWVRPTTTRHGRPGTRWWPPPARWWRRPWSTTAGRPAAATRIKVLAAVRRGPLGSSSGTT